ncbi:hypothetical protein VAT7223_02804 [Vibrio atlanticus]|uniref:Amidohydrolase-related domain-containing protein n=1 Tax=Vibrio atlanticus TaxID=693153 RepID=A0A1C3IW47_9VIBR|nr:hypothetical protein [Vibrio atlanticus]SBS65643.1 hypothetical protein VAT7223_02804 [Vibrio atlanticus]
MKKLITNVNVFNGVDNNLIENVSILIEDNLITQIGDIDPTITDETINAQGGKLGQIVEGAYADLLIIDGNPLEGVACVADTETQKLIMKDGKVYKNTL